MINPQLQLALSALTGVLSSVGADALLQKRLPSRGRPVLVGGILGLGGVVASIALNSRNGSAFAAGAVGGASLRVVLSKPPETASTATQARTPTTQTSPDTPAQPAADAHIQIALERAHSEWEKNVTEPGLGGAWERINEYIKGPEGLGKSHLNDYTRDLDFAWCGAFIAFAWGPQVHQDVRELMKGCSSMFYAWKDTPRFVPDKYPLPGDIVTLHPANDRSHAPGTHIVLAATEPDADGLFDTYEGNTIGLGPNGVNIDGVARRVRSIDRIANVYRLLPEDFNSEVSA